MRTDFEQQWKRRATAHEPCPLGDDDLRRRIRRAQWAPAAAEASTPLVQRKGHTWRWVAAAACVAAAVVPMGIGTSRTADGLATVSLGGQEVYFACNNGCQAESMVNLLNQYIDQQ